MSDHVLSFQRSAIRSLRLSLLVHLSHLRCEALPDWLVLHERVPRPERVPLTMRSPRRWRLPVGDW